MAKKQKDQPAEANPLPENRAVQASMVKVRVGRQPINEDGFRAPGETFELPRERAAALGDLVTPAQ